ncbi:hypothetical protein ABC502_08915 [Alkalimonas sp. NCh-2]|uniref:hypothetical protein n=1 Tax=Alkalimonas sp. NCh-2 TaxID=3144846 RepID=UPI0031F6A925
MKTILSMMSLLLVLALSPVQAGLLYLSPSSQHVNVGELVSIDVLVDGLSDSNEIVSGWDIQLLFSGLILQANNLEFALPYYTFDPDWDALYDSELQANSVNSFMTSFLLDDELFDLQTEPLILFTLTFEALTDGFSWVTFGADPNFERNVVGRDGLSLDLSVQGACISVGQGNCSVRVPEPASLALFTPLFLLLFRRKLF